MNHSLSRRTMVRYVAFASAAVFVLFVALFRTNLQNQKYRRAVAMGYVRAVQELAESMDKVDTDLQKCTCATSPGMIAALCTQIYGETTAANQALGALPYASIQLENTTSFLNKVGSYAQSLSKTVNTNDGYTETELKNLKTLAKASATLSDELEELSNQLNDGTLTLEDAEEVKERLSRLTENEDLFTGGSYESIEADFPELPTLIYDGPFSEHLQSRSATVLEGEETISRDKARSYAAKFLNVEPDVFTDCADVDGEIPCYVFLDDRENGSSCIVQVTKQGGYILSISSSRAIGAEKLSEKEAVAAAQKFLKDRDITSMKESYYINQGNTLTINFSATQNGVVCYPDLIKVDVALDNGEVVGFESAGYLMNHIRRENLAPHVSEKTARDAVSSELKVLSAQLALIPTKGKYEKLCWEFKCERDNGQHCLVYIGAESGEEEQILLLLEDESGTLTV